MFIGEIELWQNCFSARWKVKCGKDGPENSACPKHEGKKDPPFNTPSWVICDSQRYEEGIIKPTGFFDRFEHLEQFTSAGYVFEKLQGIIDFAAFRRNLEDALDYSDGTKGGRPSYDPVAMFTAVILAAQNNVSGERMEHLIRDHLRWPRSLGFDLGKPAPDESTDPQFSRKTDPGGRDQDAFRWV